MIVYIVFILPFQVICRSVKNQTLCGFASIVNQLVRESKDLNLADKDLATQCLITQWFEYAVLFVTPATNSRHTADIVLRELDEYLLTRSYLVGQSLTIADIVMFYALHPIVVSNSMMQSDNKVSKYSSTLKNTLFFSSHAGRTGISGQGGVS